MLTSSPLEYDVTRQNTAFIDANSTAKITDDHSLHMDPLFPGISPLKSGIQEDMSKSTSPPHQVAPQPTSTSQPPKQAAARACVECYRRKRKCMPPEGVSAHDQKYPCSRCILEGLECRMRPRTAIGREKRHKKRKKNSQGEGKKIRGRNVGEEKVDVEMNEDVYNTDDMDVDQNAPSTSLSVRAANALKFASTSKVVPHSEHDENTASIDITIEDDMPIVNLESRAPLNTTARPASSQPSTSKPFAYRTKIDPRKLTWLKDSTSSLPSLFPVSMESVGPGTFPFLCLHCRDPLSIAEEMDVDGTLLFVNENLASSIITAADHTVYMPVTRAQAAMEAQRNKWREETRGSGIRKRSAGTRKRPRARDGVWCSKCGFAYHIGCMHPAEVGMWVGDLAGWVCPGCRESPEGRGLQTVAVSGIFGVRITSVEEIDHKSTEMNNGDKEKTSEAISRENNSEVSESNDDNITLVEVNAEADSATIQASHPPILRHTETLKYLVFFETRSSFSKTARVDLAFDDLEWIEAGWVEAKYPSMVVNFWRTLRISVPNRCESAAGQGDVKASRQSMSDALWKRWDYFVLKQEKLETIVEILVSEEDDAEEDVRDRRQRRGSTISQGQVVDSNGLEGFLVGKDFPTLLKKRIDGNHSTVMYFPSSLGSQEIVNAITAIHDQKSLVLVSQSRLEHWVTALSQISKTSVTFGDLSKVGQASSVHVATVEDVCKESQLSGFRAVLWAVGPVEMVDNSEAIGSAVARISEGLTDAARILLAECPITTSVDVFMPIICFLYPRKLSASALLYRYFQQIRRNRMVSAFNKMIHPILKIFRPLHLSQRLLTHRCHNFPATPSVRDKTIAALAPHADLLSSLLRLPDNLIVPFSEPFDCSGYMAEWFRDTVGAVSGDWAARWDEIVKAVEIDEDGKKMKAIVACSEEGVKSMEMLGKEREGWKIMTPDHSTMHMRDFADTWNTLSDVGCNVLVISVDTLLTSPRLSAHRLVFAEPVHPSISITKIHECLAQVSCCNQVSNGDMDVDVSHSGLDVVWICVKGTVEEGFFEVVVRRMGKEMELLQRRNVEQTNEKWGLAMRGIGFSELKKWIGMSISGVVTEGEKVGMEEVQVYLKELGRKCREE